MSNTNTIKIRVQSYDEGTDVFTLAAFGFQEGDEALDPEYVRGAPDFDDFEVPGLVLPALIGEYGEPDEIIEQVFEIKLP